MKKVKVAIDDVLMLMELLRGASIINAFTEELVAIGEMQMMTKRDKVKIPTVPGDHAAFLLINNCAFSAHMIHMMGNILSANGHKEGDKIKRLAENLIRQVSKLSPAIISKLSTSPKAFKLAMKNPVAYGLESDTVLRSISPKPKDRRPLLKTKGRSNVISLDSVRKKKGKSKPRKDK